MFPYLVANFTHSFVLYDGATIASSAFFKATGAREGGGGGWVLGLKCLQNIRLIIFYCMRMQGNM
jgi:hypothetical protein